MSKIRLLTKASISSLLISTMVLACSRRSSATSNRLRSMQFLDSVIHLDIRSAMWIYRSKFIYDLMDRNHQPPTGELL